MRKEWCRVFGLFLLSTIGILPMLEGQVVRTNPLSNSPYSRIGLGDPVNQFLAVEAGMAGMTAAIQNPYGLNLRNSAALAFQQATSFEVGLFSQYTYLQDETNAEGQWSGNLNYLALGFPLYNPINRAIDRIKPPFSWGMSLSLQPYTTVGYNIEALAEEDPGGLVRSTFKGSGGTYRVVWGNGIRYNNLAIGGQIGYLFGKVSNDRNIAFDSLSSSFDSRFLSEFSVSGFIWNVGVMYIYDFKGPDQNGVINPTGKRLVFGAFGQSNNGFSTNSNNFFFRENLNRLRIDTLLFEEDERGSGQIPFEITAGVTYEVVQKMKVGVEYSYGQWSEYFNEAKLEGIDDLPDGVEGRRLSDSWRLSAGFEITPNIRSFDSYLKKMTYRLGGFYGKDPRSLNGVQLDNFGVTLGLGFPVILPRETVSYINLAVEAGKLGSGSSLEQSYVRMTVGFSLNDNTWFFKRKFN